MTIQDTTVISGVVLLLLILVGVWRLRHGRAGHSDDDDTRDPR